MWQATALMRCMVSLASSPPHPPPPREVGKAQLTKVHETLTTYYIYTHILLYSL